MKSYYYVDEMRLFELRKKTLLFYIMISGVLGLWMYPNGISIIIKAVFTVALIYVLGVNYYRIKNLYGLRKNPFEINNETNIFTYYNEFRGNVEIDINRIRSIKAYKGNNGIYLLEVFIKGRKTEENINVEGMSEETKANLIKDITCINNSILISSNKPETDRKKVG